MQDEASGVREAIEAAYAKLVAAVANKDLDTVRAFHVPTFIELQTDGEEFDLSKVMMEWKEFFASGEAQSFGIVVESCARNGGVVVATASSTWDYIVVQLSVRLNVRVQTLARDSWIETESGWRRRRSEIASEKAWINGRLHSEHIFEPPLPANAWALVGRELGVQAMPFETVVAGSGFADLAGLDGIIGNARIVALGEASHGSAEQFQMKHRLLEYLVERKGFTVLAMETPWAEAQLADRFIKTGEGSAPAALAAMQFWIWQTEEVRAMLDWMRAYNSSRGERPELSFAGVDMQFVNVAIKQVTALFARMDIADRDAMRQLYDGLEKLETPASALQLPATERLQLRDNAAKALALIDACREPLLKVAPPEEYRDARQAARTLFQASKMYAGHPVAERARAMADNVQWLLEEKFLGQKVVLWAHNGHVGTGPSLGEKSLGMYLRERYGEQMVVLGFASHHGAVRAKRVAEGKVVPGPPVALPLPPARKGSVDALFYEAGLARGILDLRRIRADSALATWLSKPRLHRSIGSAFDPDQPSGDYHRYKLPEIYDGVIFIAESTAAKPTI